MVKGNMLIEDKHQISVNLVILKTHGKRFEIVIEPDKIVEYKEGKKFLLVKSCKQMKFIMT
jgi:ribosome maturation protein Sdo1